MAYTNKQLVKEFKRVYKKTGELPNMKTWKKHSRISKSTYQRRFETWNKALKTIFGKTRHKTRKPNIEVICKNCSKKIMRSPSQVAKSKNHYCSNSCNAIYCNTHKKGGIRRSKLEVWLEKQLPELYPDLEFHFNRKDAINSELDIYIPNLKLAFELNGIFHYEPIFGKKKLAQIENNDERKFQACLEAGIELCVIDVSQQIYFKPKISQKYLDIITNIIDKCTMRDSNPRCP